MTYEAGAANANPATGFSEESVVGNVVTWKIASIGVGENVEIMVPVGIEASVETGSELKNEVAATSTEQTTPVEAEGTIEVTTERRRGSEKERARRRHHGGSGRRADIRGRGEEQRRAVGGARGRSSPTNCRRA